MVVPRSSVLSGGFGRTIFRRVGAQARSRSWRQVGRRTYASGHGEQQSSELPWIIGSAAVTIPAAGWLLQQGPKKGGHGHDAHAEEHNEEGEEKEETNEKEEQPEEEPKDDSEQKSDDDKEDKNDDGDDDKKEEKSDDAGDDSDESADSKDQGSDSDDGHEKPGSNGPKQINWHSGMSKGPGEGQKGDRKPTEKKGEKDAQGTSSGAKHPYIDDPEKSKKGLGVTETARIHGTVDTRSGARGVGGSGSSSS